MFTVWMRAVWVGALMLLTLTMGQAEIAYVLGGTTYLPVKLLNEAVGDTNEIFDAKQQTVTFDVFHKGNIVFQLGSDIASLDGTPVKLGAKPFRLDNTTYVPLGAEFNKACGFTTVAPKDGFLPVTYAIPENVTEFTAVNHTYKLVLLTLTPAELALRQQPVANADARAVFNAVAHNDAKVVAQLMKAHPELRFAQDGSGALPLQYAVNYRLEEMIKVLLANGASLEDRNPAGFTALHVAVSEIFGTIMMGHDIGQVDQPGFYPEGSSVEGTVKLLIKLGSNVNAPDNDGKRPLHWACGSMRQHPDIIPALLAAGANVNAKDGYGRTPLFVLNSSTAGELLLAKGADIKHCDNFGATALQFSAADEEGGNTLYLKFLLEHGVPIDVKDEDGATALMNAATSGNIEVVTLLLDKGADVNAASASGLTALANVAGSNPDNENGVTIVKLLLARGARVNPEQDGMYTALHRACYRGNVAIAKLLLAAGAKVNAKDPDGETPLQTAKQQKHLEVIKLLVAAGAK